MSNPAQENRGFNVGVVACDHALRSALKFLLFAAGFHVREYRSAGEYLSLTVNPHHCIVVDCSLRDMGARRLCEQILNAGAALPVVAVTSSPEDFHPGREGHRLLRVVAKPFVGEAFIEAIRELILAAGTPATTGGERGD